MPIVAEGQEPKRSRRSFWWFLALILPAGLLAFLLLPCAGPLDFQLGPTSVLIEYEPWDGAGKALLETTRLDFPGVRNYDYPVGEHVYRLNGTARCRGLRLWNQGFFVAWCGGRRVK